MGISTSTINSSYKIYNNPLIKKSIFLLLQKSTTKILLVEGDGDVPFYSKYINSSVTISEVTKTKDYKFPEPSLKYSDGQKTAKKYVQFLVNEHKKKVKINNAIKYGSCYGIVDQDFDGLNTFKYSYMGKNIICTDQRDLETTLISFGKKIVENRFYCDYNYDCGTFNVLQESINEASKIGKLRLLREKNKKQFHGNSYLTNNFPIDFNVKETCGESSGNDGYFIFIKNGKFDLPSYLGYPDKQNQINKILSTIKNYNKNNLSYCRGHDIFNFVTCFYKLANKIKPEYLSNSCGINKITNIRGHYEELLKESFFDEPAFKAGSQIYRFLQKNKLT